MTFEGGFLKVHLNSGNQKLKYNFLAQSISNIMSGPQ